MAKTFIGMASIDDSLNFEDGKLNLNYGDGLEIDSNKKVSVKKNGDNSNGIIMNENGLYCDTMPIGSLLLWAANDKNPNGRGWLLCNGAEVNRITYKDLFNVIGTTWGAGNGTTTFNLPNQMKDGNTRWLAVDNNNCDYWNQGLPNIEGSRKRRPVGLEMAAASGALGGWAYSWEYTGGWAGGGAFGGSGFGGWVDYFNASASNSIYGAKGFVCPYTLKVKLFIKAFI